MKTEAAIFDMDGTLVDSVPFFYNAETSALKRHGVTNNIDAAFEMAKTRTLFDAVKFYTEYFHLEESPEEIFSEIDAEMERQYRENIQLKPGVKKYLQKLASMGFKMCIASATDDVWISNCLERLGVRQYFSFILSCTKLGVSKASPAVFLDAAERLQVSPENTAVYEDSLLAIKTAHSAGFQTVGIQDSGNADSWDEIVRIANKTVVDWRSADI